MTLTELMNFTLKPWNYFQPKIFIHTKYLKRIIATCEDNHIVDFRLARTRYNLIQLQTTLNYN